VIGPTPFTCRNNAVCPYLLPAQLFNLFVNTTRGLVKSMGTRLPKCSSRSFAHKGEEAVAVEMREALLPLVRLAATLSADIDLFVDNVFISGYALLVISLDNPQSLGSVVNRHSLPALNRCETCGKRRYGDTSFSSCKLPTLKAALTALRIVALTPKLPTLSGSSSTSACARSLA
jgi:hypothetical protein